MVKPESVGVQSSGRERDPLSADEKLWAAQLLTVALAPEVSGRTLELDTAQGLGARDSAHDVFFVRTHDRDAQRKRQTFACKRFRRLENAQREIAAIGEARRRGFTTLTPARQGIVPMDELGYLFVTEQMPRFTTMNYLGWRDFYAGQPDYQRKAAAPLSKIGRFVAEMHSAGIRHGDLQVKNIAQNFSGEFVLFDLEDAVFYDKDDRNSPDFISNVSDDLQVLIGSLVTRGYLWSSTDVTFEQEVTTHLLEPYLDSIEIHDTAIVDGAAHAVEEGLMLRRHLHGDFSSRIGMPS